MHTLADDLGARLARNPATGTLDVIIELPHIHPGDLPVQAQHAVPLRSLIDDLLATTDDPYTREAYAEQFEHLVERFHAIAAEG